MQKEINFYQEMASEHRLQEYSKGPVPLFFLLNLNPISFIYGYSILFMYVQALYNIIYDSI